MSTYRAAWVCPIDRPPLQNGWVAVANGRIVEISDGQPPGTVSDLGRVALMPGLVNAHTHLELSWLRGRVPPADGFTRWVAQLFLVRGAMERADDPVVVAAAVEAAGEARRFGTVAVGDISNSLASVAPIAAAGLRGIVFHELLGFKERDGRLVELSRGRREALASHGVTLSVAPHAPYSVSAELFRAVRSAVDAADVRITSVHLGESAEEVEMLATGTGTWPRLLRQVDAWREDWVPPRCGPVAYLDDLAFIDERTLVVHGVQFDDESLARLAKRGATIVTCPRSNQWVGVGAPPIDRFYRSGAPIAVGTDSLASVDDLNVFSELRAMRWLAPRVPARRLLESATASGARALGLGDELGTLSPGKLAEILAIELPDHVADIEEFLVGGIEPRSISWLVAN